MLKTGPFLRLECHEFNSKVLTAAPPDHCLLYPYRWLVFGRVYAKFQRRAGVDLGEAVDFAPAERYVQDVPVSINKLTEVNELRKRTGKRGCRRWSIEEECVSQCQPFILP